MIRTVESALVQRTRKLKVCCPICGNELMKSARADDEIRCLRCKERIIVVLENERMMIAIDQRARA